MTAVGYRGKVDRNRHVRASCAPKARRSRRSPTTSASRNRQRVALGARHRRRDPARPARPPAAATAPQHLAKLAEIEECDRLGARAHRHACPTRRFSPRESRSTRGRARSATARSSFANTDAAMVAFFCAWLRRFFDDRRSSPPCPCVPARGTRPRRRRAFWSEVTGVPLAVPGAVPGQGGSDDPARQARVRLRVRRLLAARGRIGRSWGSSGRCYPRAPFRGSSIGRAAAC